MKQIFIRVLTLFILLSGGSVFAQTNKKAPADSKKKTTQKTDDKKGKKGDKGKSLKDSQNQMQFMKPDVNATDYNFYDRKKISTPLMPRYDLDSMAFQKGKKKGKQQQAFLANKYHYPTKPKDQWELGVNFGLAIVSGDVRPYWAKPWQNVGAGFTIRKSLGYVFSLRMAYNYYHMTGRDFKPRTAVDNNNSLGAGLDVRRQSVDSALAPTDPGYNGKNNYSTSGNSAIPGVMFYNYRTIAHQIQIEGVISLGNLLFHKERNKVGFYVFGGIGLTFVQTKYDARDKNGKLYNYKVPYDIWQNPDKYPGGFSSRSQNILNALDTMMDGTYDTYGDNDNYSTLINHFQVIPTATAGAAITFHASKFMTVSIEEKATISTSRLLDGMRWAEGNIPTMTDRDVILYTNLQLLFHIGKNRTEPLYWMNPMDYAYKKLSDVNPEKLAKDILKDTDEDGVPDRLDKEPNSKKGCPVDVKGVVLDSDKDGIPDCDDKEPFSPPGYTIDQYGVAQVPPNPCCDNNDTSAGGKNGKGRRGGSNYDCSKIELPGVFYDADRYDIGPEYYSALHQVAERLQMCPDVKMVVNGFDESHNDQKYNEQLAYNRATSVVDYLVEKYGISRDRFIVKYQGGKKALTGKSTNEMKKSRKVDIHYATDGEKGESNPPAPHPGLKAGSNK